MAYNGGNMISVRVDGGSHEEELCELFGNVAVSKNIKQRDLLDYGFSNIWSSKFSKIWKIKRGQQTARKILNRHQKEKYEDKIF